MITEKEILKLQSEVLELRKVIKAYDKTINNLPVDLQISIINEIPKHYNEKDV